LAERVAAPVWKAENTALGIRHADHMAPSISTKLALSSLTSGGRSVGIVRSRTQTTKYLSSFLARHRSEACNVGWGILPDPLLTSVMLLLQLIERQQPLCELGSSRLDDRSVRLSPDCACAESAAAELFRTRALQPGQCAHSRGHEL
jgi:hypothetical protein